MTTTMTAPTGVGSSSNRPCRFAPLRDHVADPLGYEAGDVNLRRYVGNGPLSATDPSGLESKPQGQKDEEAFREALKKNGVDPKIVGLILQTARDTPVPGGNVIGSHKICFDWVQEFEKRLQAALIKELTPPDEPQSPRFAVPGIIQRGLLILDVPLGAQGNKLDDIPWTSKNWILPTFFDMLNYGGPARIGSANGLPLQECDTMAWRKWWLSQDHTVYRMVLADGSVWYIDLGAIQSVRAAEGSIDDLDSGVWHVTPSTSLPNGWTPVDLHKE